MYGSTSGSPNARKEDALSLVEFTVYTFGPHGLQLTVPAGALSEMGQIAHGGLFVVFSPYPPVRLGQALALPE